jgi:hypothetical protein
MRVAKFNSEGNISIVTAEMPVIEKNEVKCDKNIV